jgi:hypothetical protein
VRSEAQQADVMISEEIIIGIKVPAIRRLICNVDRSFKFVSPDHSKQLTLNLRQFDSPVIGAPF